MIAKIRTGNYFKGVLKYNTDKVELNKAVAIGSFGFKTDKPAFEEVLAMFQRMAKIHPMKKPVVHIPISFAPGEHFDDSKLIAIARDYMQRMGFGRTPYAIFRHDDTSQQHLHVVSVNMTVNAKGKYEAIANSYNYFKNNRVCRELERKYGLVIADKKKYKPEKVFHLEEPQIRNYGEIPTFEYLRTVGDFILSKRLFVNLYELNQFLFPYSIAVFSNTSRQGEKYYKLTFIDKEKRKSVGIGGTPEMLKMNFTQKSIDDLFLENRQKLKAFLQQVKKHTSQWIKDNYSMSETDIGKKLQKVGLSYVATGIYSNVENGRQFNLRQLGIPDTYIKPATVSKEYYKAFIRTVTAFRREKKIFYESTLLADSNLTEKLRTYAKEKLNTLSKAQVNVLTDGYLSYKWSHLHEIEEKERQKDILWVNKLIAYIGQTELNSCEDQILFLSKLGVEINGNNVLLRNSTDDIVHILNKSDVLPIPNPPSAKGNFRKTIENLSDIEWKVIKSAINGRFEYSPEADYKLLKSFLPKSYMIQIPQLKQNYVQKNIKQNILSALIPSHYDIHPGKLLKWDDDEEDEEKDEEDLRRGKNRKKL